MIVRVRMKGWGRVFREPVFVVGVGLGAALGWGLPQLIIIDWHQAVPPLDEPLVIRADAKGDGRFDAPRSGNRRHHGVDLEAPLGSPVRAIRGGLVIASGKHRGLGRYIEVEHANRLRSLYGHLDALLVPAGARVRQGDVIGTVGKTGNARHPLITPHVHLEVRRDGSPIDPATLGLALIAPSTPSEHADADGGE